MRCSSVVLLACLFAAAASGGALAQRVEKNLNAETAEKMAAACVAYAKARNAAVNVWVFDGQGALLHFQRMDGAPPAGPSVGPGLQFGTIDSFLGGAGASSPQESAGGVPVVVDGSTVGTARAAGMGAAGDRACARAAVEAASDQGGQDGR
jgi:uncharacterized protein GlcG (DUF336 family)